ncbi:hypothetical protein HBR94_09395 [Pseudomonas sp. WS 5412]|uniref:hypothetical protein n=1 Tax=Pseudomonas sp. WS 5412 TaxID=2717487 RepID=UPI001473479C|nr:hypothetical protein [Pseudomonas sp. WS 5412]NMY31711.1 hypothetical protein [Pseudomonas sp. WS 5412]
MPLLGHLQALELYQDMCRLSLDVMVFSEGDEFETALSANEQALQKQNEAQHALIEQLKLLIAQADVVEP